MRCIFTCLFSFVLSISAVTLDELRNTTDLTPQKFASFFSDFEFKFHAEVQAPEAFLATQSGDCDDYAILAATVLKEKGYTPRLITIRMPDVTHVICYIAETKSYLDYNCRQYLVRTVSSGPSIAEIADSVAASYHLKWSSASEFAWTEGNKRLVATVLAPTKPGRFAALFGFKSN
jgi:hypothetical protein